MKIRKRLQLQLFISIIEDAHLYAAVKGPDNVRMRAMKAFLMENISELVLDFFRKNKYNYEVMYAEFYGPILVMGRYRGSQLAVHELYQLVPQTAPD